MNLEAYSAIGILFVTIVGFVWRVSYMLNSKVSYESFDRLKKDVRENFVHKDVFDLTYSQVKADLIEIKGDIKTLLKKANG